MLMITLPAAPQRRDPALAGPAAKRAFEISDIRRVVLSHLEAGDLARVMRTGRECLGDGAAELYRNITYAVAMSIDQAIPRQAMYAQAVVEIDGRSLTLSSTLLSAVLSQLNAFPRHQVGRYTSLEIYRESSFNLVVPPLKRAFPALRKVIFGGRDDWGSHSFWTVRFDATYIDDDPVAQPDATGHIHLIHPLHLRCYAPPPPDLRIHCPVPPPANYTMNERLNVQTLSDDRGPPSDPTPWLQILRNDPAFDLLYQYFHVGDLPITMSDLVGLYDRQIVKGYEKRLGTIIAHCIMPWGIYDFGQLSQVASASLTKLELCGKYLRRENPSALSFADLPSFIDMVKTDLPNLAYLRFPINGITTAETLCGGMLHPHSLDHGGTISTLQLVTTEHDSTLFNVIRALSPICTSYATLTLSSNRRRGWDESAQQTGFLHYLRGQPPSRRVHLATVSFTSLDVLVPSDIYSLQYSDDGQPIRLSESKALLWHNDAQTAENTLNHTLPTLAAEMRSFTESSARLKTLSTSSASAAELLLEAEQMLEAVRALNEASAELQKVIGENQKSELDILRFVGTLRAIAGKARDEGQG